MSSIMLNKNLLLDINWIKEDKNQRLIYLPSFYKLYENISNLLSQKIENEGYQRVYLDEDFLFENEEYSYYFNNKKYVELRYRNSNFELSKQSPPLLNVKNPNKSFPTEHNTLWGFL